jgi:hypothetical protein
MSSSKLISLQLLDQADGRLNSVGVEDATNILLYFSTRINYQIPGI